MEPMTIESSRRRYALLLLGSLTFVAIAAFLPHGADEGWRLPSGIFFGLCALVFLVLLARPQRLSLDSRGLTVSGGLVRKPWTIAWSDIDHFTPMQAGMIGFTYRDGAAPESSLRRFNRTMSNVDGGIPGRWTRSTPEMLALLEDYRSKSVGAAARTQINED